MSPERASEDLRLRVLLPTRVLLDEPVRKVVAEAVNGSFCLLPRHLDFVAALVPGILVFVDADGRERFAAIDEGALVKCAETVTVSALDGAVGDALEELQALVDERYAALDEQEKKARSAVARLEAGTLRRFRELQEQALD
ncbi:F0F1 ATP synthase subunit epsilon [Thioalkalivibrio sp. XN8]|uniref:F0F1 ATP synthase subunit epsilon n=1 Tax=Thioalkalivibrio sp. XN8 TaxID=2712863 RepID=UPI0019820193|nr:F0F1 ATP synthase subunit epsilon [Thioalkalivibrio sp. XN8]